MSVRTAMKSGGGHNMRIAYLDYLRAFCPLIIIAVHIMESPDALPEYDSPDFFWLSAIMRICRVGMPMFCMISGALFLNPKKPFSMKKHFTKTIPRILLAYLVWSPIYALVVTLLSDKTGHDQLMYFLEKMFTGYWHLWYLEMLIAAYLLVPLLRKIAESLDTLRYAVGLIIFTMTVWTAKTLLETLVLMRESEGILKATLSNVDGSIMATVGYLGVSVISFFLVGSLLARERFNKKQRIIIYILGLAGLLMMILFSAMRSRVLGTDFAFMDGGLTDIGTFFYICAVFVFVKELLSKKKSVGKVTAFMAKHSFGVYILHLFPVIVISKYYIIPAWRVPEMFVVIPGSVIIVYLLGLLASWLLSKIPLVRRTI